MAWATNWNCETILQKRDNCTVKVGQAESIQFMKTKFCVWIFLLGATFAQAQTNGLTPLLQQGLFDEEANQDLNAAIAKYKSLATQFDKDRQVAATAVYRLGECYRKLGQTNEATVQYERIVREFPDQKTLATLSQQNLTGMGATTPQHTAERLAAIVTRNQAGANTEAAAFAADVEAAALKAQIAGIENLDREQKLIFVQQNFPNPVLTTLTQQLLETEQKFAVATNDYDLKNLAVVRLTSEINTINHQIDDQISGVLDGLRAKYQLARDRAKALHEQFTQAHPDQSRTALATDEEEQEIRRIQQMIQNSPDLINAPGDTSGYPPLMQAATSDHLRVAQYLLDNKANVNVKIRNGDTPLTVAAMSGHKAMVELLLSHGADVNAEGGFGYTALLQAASRGFQAVAEVLLANKADVNAAKDDGETPLHLAAGSGRAKIVQMLLAAGADPNLRDKNGRTPLNCYGSFSDSPEIVQALLGTGTDVNTEDVFGRTPLSYAAERGDPVIVELLLNAGADPNGGKQDAPVFCAIKQGNTNSLELLLRAGAHRNMAGAFNLSVDHSTADFSNHSGHLTPLWMAVYLDQFPMVQMLLKFKADPNDSETDGRSLLFRVLSNTNILEALLDAGAKVDPISADETQWTPLGAAANQNNASAVEILLKHGANPNVRDRNGATPLHWTAYQLADSNVFELLLANKADPNVRSNDGKTPLAVLKERLATNVLSPEQKTLAGQLADLLRQHGALDNLPNWDRITVSRPSANFSFTIFRKGTNDWNQFTLLETILNYYESSQMFPVPRGNNTWESFPAKSMMLFPDLARVVIVRPSHGSTNQTRIAINLLNSTNGIDCSKDVPLAFGDVVEIPERDHSLGDQLGGLTSSQRDSIVNHLKGNVQLLVRDQKVELPLYPIGYDLTIGAVLRQPEAQKLLLSSSDLSRVKVSRHDPKTGKKREWILDCSNAQSPSNGLPVFGQNRFVFNSQSGGDNQPPAPDLRLRDGDVIEVPEKP